MNVYLVDIRTLRVYYDNCLVELTPERRKKTLRYRNENDRLRSAAAGLLLRAVLRVYQDDLLVYNEFGKPFLAQGGKCFSLSHGGNYTALAVADSDVGVDVEPLGCPDMKVARRVFTSDELSWMEEVEGDIRFYLLWTRKESIIKADGKGFSLPPQDFSVLTGCHWYSENMIFDGHVLACAAHEPFSIQCKTLSPELLLCQDR
jgi:4'-phosphopantetheinyl transferase